LYRSLNEGKNMLSPIKTIALKLLDTIRDQIINGECSDEDMQEAMVRFHPSVNKEYYNPKDYCNYDEACDILNLSHNRNKLKHLCDKYNVHCVFIKNRPLGFPRKDILMIKEEQQKLCK
jgi:hypothetical protein